MCSGAPGSRVVPPVQGRYIRLEVRSEDTVGDVRHWFTHRKYVVVYGVRYKREDEDLEVPWYCIYPYHHPVIVNINRKIIDKVLVIKLPCSGNVTFIIRIKLEISSVFTWGQWSYCRVEFLRGHDNTEPLYVKGKSHYDRF